MLRFYLVSAIIPCINRLKAGYCELFDRVRRYQPAFLANSTTIAIVVHCSAVRLALIKFCHHTMLIQLMGFGLAINDGAAEVDHNAFPVGTFRWKMVNMISPHRLFI